MTEDDIGDFEVHREKEDEGTEVADAWDKAADALERHIAAGGGGVMQPTPVTPERCPTCGLRVTPARRSWQKEIAELNRRCERQRRAERVMSAIRSLLESYED